MRSRRNSRRQLRVALWQRWTAWGALGLVVLLDILAASPEAHAWVHGRQFVYQLGSAAGGDVDSNPDRHSDDDEVGCIVTKFAVGHVDSAPILLFAWPTTLVRPEYPWRWEAQFFPTADFRYPFCCGPPAAS